MGKSESEKIMAGTEDDGKVKELFDTKAAKATPPADHQQSQSGGATPYPHPAVQGAVPGEQVMASGEVKAPPPAAHPAPEPPKTPVVEKKKPTTTESKPTGPQCPKCGSTSIGMAGGMRRCNQCSNSF